MSAIISHIYSQFQINNITQKFGITFSVVHILTKSLAICDCVPDLDSKYAYSLTPAYLW